MNARHSISQKSNMAHNAFLCRMALGVVLPALIAACGSGAGTVENTESEDAVSETPETSEASEASEASETAAINNSEDLGELALRANGEDFVRQGFVTKDGWQIDFDHLYVNLSEMTVYQSDPPFDPEADEQITAATTVGIDEPITIDLAAGDETAEPVLVETLEAPAGRYNALSWKMTPAVTGPAEGYSLVMQGQASKASEVVNFTLKLEPTLGFVCGDYVGDERKGILAANDKADLEATFHFDHLFGDGDAPADDAINTEALGFDPLAAIAEGDTLNVDSSDLQSRLSSEEYELLMGILPSLGHVGEGHCQETELTDS